MDLSTCSPADLAGMISAAMAAGGLMGGFAGWLLRARQQLRDITPIFTMRGDSLEVMNRCSEPLIVEEVRARGRICTSKWQTNAWGQPDKPIFEGNRCAPFWEIGPLATCYFPVAIEDPSEASLIISARSRLGTINSSFKTAL